MAPPTIVNIYRQYLLRLIGDGLQNAAGKPKNVVTDEKTYRDEVLEPAWSLLPLSLIHI